MSETNQSTNIESEYDGESDLTRFFTFCDNSTQIKLLDWESIDIFIINFETIKFLCCRNDKELIFKEDFYYMVNNNLLDNLEILMNKTFNKCKEHNKEFEYYCKLCKKRFCSKCVNKNEFKHNNHLFNFNLNYE